GIGASLWRSVGPADVVPRPAKPARQTVRAPRLRTNPPGPPGAVFRVGLVRKVCRAGFAGRGMPSALSTGWHPRVRPRPETESRVGSTGVVTERAPLSLTRAAARRTPDGVRMGKRG